MFKILNNIYVLLTRNVDSENLVRVRIDIQSDQLSDRGVRFAAGWNPTGMLTKRKEVQILKISKRKKFA